MTRPSRNARPILVVEDQAHSRYGHYPRGCLSLARALTELGCDVTLLTTRGLAPGGGDPNGCRVERFGRTAAVSWFVAHRLAPSIERTHWTRRARWSAYAAATWRAATVALATRRALRRRAEPAPDVILFGHDLHAFVLAGLVGRGRFVHHAFRPPPGDRPHTAVGRVLDQWVRGREADRRRHRGGFRVAAATSALVDAWRRRAAYLDPVVIGHAMSRFEQPVEGARAAFGIDDDARVALVFGADHGNKDLETVWRAFLALPEWTLLVVGHVGDAFRAFAAEHDAPDAVVVGGYVDEATRARAYSAADLVVLSFEADHRRDSGVLQDALSFARPLVCSDGSDAARRVREFGLGSVFEPSNVTALVDAVRDAPRSLTTDAVERALVGTSDVSVARAHLDALDELAGGGPDQPGRK